MHYERFLSALPFLGIAILILVAYLNWRLRKKRREAWASLATSLGCAFSPRVVLGNPFLTSPQDPLSRDPSQRTYNVMHGVYKGHQLRCFDYRYSAVGNEGEDSRKSFFLTCLVVQAPIPFPPLSLRPEGFRDHLRHAIGIEDINFESDEFNRKFSVACPDRKFAYDVIHQGAIEYLLHHSSMHIAGNGMSVVFHFGPSRGLLPLPAAVMDLLDASCEFLDLLPAYLTGQHAPPVAAKELPPPASN